MILFIFFMIAAVLLGFLLWFVPNPFNRSGKVTILLTSILLSVFGLLAANLLPTWQTVLLLLVLSTLIGYLVDKNSGEKLSERESQASSITNHTVASNELTVNEEESLVLPDVKTEDQGTFNEADTTYKGDTLENKEELVELIYDDQLEDDFLLARIEDSDSQVSEEQPSHLIGEDTIPELSLDQEIWTDPAAASSPKETTTDIDLDELELYKELYQDNKELSEFDPNLEENKEELEIEELNFIEKK
ncbi:hypothetical protein ACOI1C_03475 [Bacillus sp. DJP31]|uniref:hypothetical protein n=1 Tax=Bacillus sp. DJP31 TaxID=3409789 RepID=UPI003BB58A96